MRAALWLRWARGEARGCFACCCWARGDGGGGAPGRTGGDGWGGWLSWTPKRARVEDLGGEAKDAAAACDATASAPDGAGSDAPAGNWWSAPLELLCRVEDHDRVDTRELIWESMRWRLICCCSRAPPPPGANPSAATVEKAASGPGRAGVPGSAGPMPGAPGMPELLSVTVSDVWTEVEVW